MSDRPESTDLPLVIQAADLKNPRDAADYLAQLDAYARDPLGAGTALPPERLQRTVEQLAELPHARLFLARTNDQAVGFATCFSTYSTFRAAPLWNIHDIAVLETYRGKGIGRQLIEHIGKAAHAEGCCKLTLEVREDNPVAESLYRSEGFAAAQIGETEVQFLFLEKTLD